MKVALEQETLTVTRFPGGPARTLRVWLDRLVTVADDGPRGLVLTLDDGETVRLAGLGRERAAGLRLSLEAIVADIARDAAPARDLGALAARLRDLLEAPGFSPRRWVGVLTAQAAALTASDVHIEPGDDGARVLVRRHGTLYPVGALPAAIHPRVMATLKLRAGLPSYRTDIPQEGRIEIGANGRRVDARLSVLPTVAGEKATLRLFQPALQTRELDGLGLPDAVVAGLRAALRSPGGLLLIGGPSGSGKTTTAYAALREVLRRDGDRARIAAVEDPVEAVIPGVQQMAVDRREDLTYERAVSHLLRQDVDVLMIGEIRDRETARAAVQAALTGHLTVSTLHCARAVEAFERLLELGVPRGRLAETVVAVVGQRLVRLRCDHAGAGADCPRCLGTGWDGRRPAAELVTMTPALAAALREKRSGAALAVAADGATASIGEIARAWATDALTTDEEAARCD